MLHYTNLYNVNVTIYKLIVSIYKLMLHFNKNVCLSLHLAAPECNSRDTSYTSNAIRK